jgi:hypothetical protein
MWRNRPPSKLKVIALGFLTAVMLAGFVSEAWLGFSDWRYAEHFDAYIVQVPKNIGNGALKVRVALPRVM